MTLKTPSNRKEFDEFPAYFDSKIAPYLQGQEDTRQDAVMKFGMVLIAGAVAAMAAWKFLPFVEGNLQAAVFTAFGTLAFASWRLNKTRSAITNGLLQRVAGKLSLSYRQEMIRPPYYEDFKQLKLLPNFEKEEWEDEVRGAHAGADFVMCEAHFKVKTKNSYRTVFHGQLIELEYPKEFLGQTVVRRDAGMMNRLMKPGKAFARVGLASPEFEKAFEAWSTDQVEARDLLDPIVLERFQELERLFNGKQLRAAFTGGKLLIAIETGDRLNMGSMFKSLHGKDRVETILAEFDTIFDLIDVLVKRVDGRMDGAFSAGALREKRPA